MGDFTIGEKRISANPAIPSESYDTLQKQTLLVSLQGGLSYQIIVNKRTALYQDISAGTYFNDEVLKNELNRLGGLRSIRGFNENFFFAQHYTLSRLELRQYFERQSYFLIFYDQLIYAQRKAWDYPRGFGTGLALQTSNGLFSFALAMGASKEVPLNIANMKIHLGYISRF